MRQIALYNLPQALLLAVEMPKGSILSFDKDLLIRMLIQWFNIILLTVIIVFILYKPVRKFMENRTARIKNDIDSARLSNEEALALKEKYEMMIENIEKERDEILHQAYRMAMERSDQLLLSARQEAQYMYNKAEAELELERKNADDSIKRQIIELSVLMASRFVEVSIDEQTQEKYVDEVIANWGKNPW